MDIYTNKILSIIKLSRLCPGECPDWADSGDGLPQGPAGHDEGGLAQHERHQRQIRVGGARGQWRACADWRSEAAQSPLRGVSAQAAESDETIRGVSCGGGV